ncbi:hypothetical protein HYC85_021063 [Camellia sinensis]|uniref:Uncharacterized protein n=1 Tax=Camellia sinensis TaxID=4442 RepID=A0A7J7GKE5_CAMSI|nr:hypothetical protein HYC85_021063 [Camellia sinensis]
MPKSRSKQKVVESSKAEFHSKEVDSNGKGKSMRLYCSHQNIIKPIDFEVVRGVNVNNRYHDIISEPPTDYMINRYNFERKYTLTPAGFDYTLKE